MQSLKRPSLALQLASLLVPLLAVVLVGCKDAPGNDGRYATHGDYVGTGYGRWAP